MAVDKFFGVIGNNPGLIAYHIVLMSKESVTTLIMKVDRVDNTKASSLIKLLSET